VQHVLTLEGRLYLLKKLVREHISPENNPGVHCKELFITGGNRRIVRVFCPLSAATRKVTELD
jgi:hypothetical protein